MEICFIPNDDYAGFIEARGVIPPVGNFVDDEGKILGKHSGIHHFTIGQRRGLGIALGKPAFVSAIRPDANEVVLSTGDGLHFTKIAVTNPHWLCDVSGSF